MGKPQNSRGGVELHTAARSGDMNAVQSILSSNPLAVNSRDKHSRTPLHLAAWSGQAEAVSYLCQHKADVGAAAMNDMGAIHFAAQRGHLEVVRALVSAGASVKISTRKGMTSLHCAAQGPQLEFAKYLVKKGSNLNAKTKARKTALDLASSEEIRNFLEEFERSSKNGKSNNKKKAEESNMKTSTSGMEDNLEAEPPAVAIDEESIDREKRKSNEDDVKEATSQPKKARVNLGHLQSSDDAQEEEEDQ